MKLAAYSTYKRSGVNWLGDVPTHWDVLPLKRGFRVVNGGTPVSRKEAYWDGNVTWFTPEDLGKNHGKKIRYSRRKLSLAGLSNCGAQLVPRGSVVLSTRAPIGHLAITLNEACTNQGCRALVPVASIAIADFLYYSLVASRGVLQANGKGTTFSELAAGTLQMHTVPFPPLDEQRAIVAFLDSQTARIDTLVAKKRALIERIRERRTALISRTVVRGLPPDLAESYDFEPNIELKPSGLEWIGEIPGTWNTTRISLLARKGANTFTDGDWIELPYITESGIRLLQTGNVGIGEYREQGFRYISESSFSELECTEVEPGDVLICRLAAPVGRACLAPTLGCRMITSVDVCILKPRASMDRRYVVYLMSSKMYLDYVASLCRGGTRDRISRSMLGAIRAIVPPLREQQIIADFLDRETATIASLLTRIETAIERLHEYRAALITAAVTGKIDVHEATG